MMGLAFSGLAFVAAFLFGRASLGLGMASVLATGYFYGILRANYYDGFSHFIFDCACLGLYLAQLDSILRLLAERKNHPLVMWFKVLVSWPIILFMLFFLFPQHPIIQFIGLRAALWFLPFLLLGGAATERDLNVMARALAVLNLAALALAVAEYRLGIERFFPKNPVTELLYRSKDIAGFTAYRIPGPFTSSAAYGGMMAATVPWLFGRWIQPRVHPLESVLMLAGMLAAALGVFLCGSRSPVIHLFAMACYMVLQLRSQLPALMLMLVAGLGVAYVVSNDERLQRFTTLDDADAIVKRIHGSAHVGILEVLMDYPMGNGLGGAVGTSIPSFFLQYAADFKQVGGENEYSRIALELGILGLLLWLGFLATLLLRRPIGPTPAWNQGARLVWIYTLLCWATAIIGTGMMTAIPGTALLLFGMGMISGVGRRPVLATRKAPSTVPATMQQPAF